MPNFRKLEPEEIQTVENKGKGLRKITEEQYDAILADYDVGDYGEAMLEDGDNRLTVRNRLKAAANRRDIAIEFRRTQGDILRFRITERDKNSSAAPVEPPEVVSSEPPAKPKGKGGRPKKNP